HGWPVHIWLALAQGDDQEAGIPSGQVTDADMLGAALSRDARVNFHIAHRSVIGINVLRGPLVPWQRDMLRSGLDLEASWVVDARSGAGWRGGRAQPFTEWPAAINLSGRPVLAVDTPSGLDCDEGEPMGQTVRAAHTATFVAWKKGFVQPAAKPWLGEVH